MLAIVAATSLLGPIAGKLIDGARINRLLGVIDLARGLTTAAFVIVAAGWGVSELSIYAFAFLNGALSIVYRPSVGALIPKLVGPSNIVQANSAMGMIFSAMGVFLAIWLEAFWWLGLGPSWRSS